MSVDAASDNATGEPVLIAAFSGRALAASARRAGFVPLVVDCFGDQDMRALATDSRCLPARIQVGFTARPLLAALEELAAAAPRAPIGLVLGSGFECNPRLVARLAERFKLIGNTAETIRRVKDPSEFFGTLDRLGIPHPETRLEPPPDPSGWLMKRIGGSGGLHIHRCPTQPRPDPRRYFQRQVPGEPISAMMLAGRSVAFAFSRQWASPLRRRPFRYGGAVGWVSLDEDLEARIVDACLHVAPAFDLQGLLSFDFVVADGEPLLTEVNPRPGATLDVLDDDHGTLFAAHVEAVRGRDPASVLARQFRQPRPKAAAYLYADRGTLTVPTFKWPTWSADRPSTGAVVGRGQPLATVIAESPTGAEAERLCRERLGLLSDMLYENQIEKEAPR